MTGTLLDAMTAVRHFDTDNTYYLLSDQGTTRIVYLINGVVYKVDLSGTSECNASEYLRSQALRGNLPEGFDIPSLELYRVSDQHSVIAMEYIDGKPCGECIPQLMGSQCDHYPGECISQEMTHELYSIGLLDPGYGNLIFRDGVHYIVDCVV